MPDEVYWDIHEELMIILDREPTYEEVIEFYEKKFSVSPQEKREYYEEKYYG